MSFIKTFINGEEGLFKSETLTPMQKLTLRFVVVGLIYFGFVVIEGMLMRLYEVKPFPFITEPQFFCNSYSTSAGWDLRLNILYRFRSIPFPCSILNEKTIVEY